jgi:nucleoside-diphosphate-sugar epimerase
LKLLITGSGTLLGNNVVLEALKKHYIYASYRKSYPKNLKKKNVTLIKLDLEKKFNINFKVDCLIHCASAIPSENLSDKKMMNTNYFGFKKLASQAIKNGCKKIILISTMSVYGKINSDKVDLKTKIRPIDAYGRSKFKSEQYLMKLSRQRKIDFFILRLPALVGINSDYNFISKVLKKIKNNKPLIYSNPDLKFNNFIHVKNLTQIIIKLVKFKGPRVLNVASTNPIKLKNIIQEIYRFEKKKNIAIIQKSKDAGFNIQIDSFLKKNFNIFTTKKNLKLFLIDNR